MTNTAALRPLAVITCLYSLCATAQPNGVAIPTNLPPNTNYIMVLVTNWYNPEPGLRTINGQVYNPSYAQIWQTIVIPMGAAAVNPTYSGSVQPVDLTFEWGPVEGREHQTVTVLNFPYNPIDFQHEHGNPYSDIVTRHTFAVRVLPVNIQTNWSPLGRSWLGPRTYDYGLPYTGRVPVVTWQRVPADQAPKTGGAVIRIPKHSSSFKPDSYTMGSLSDRMEAIQSIESPPRRDSNLVRLATDAAREDNVAIAEQALGDISNSSMRDSAAQMAATMLAQAGKTGDAYAVVAMITNPQHRRLTLELLHHESQ